MSLLLTVQGGVGPTTFFQSNTGALSFVGVENRRTNKIVNGAISFLGVISKQTNKALVGALSFSGALSSIRLFTKAIAGALSFAGTISKSINKPLIGQLSFAGSIAKQTRRAVSGVLSFVGSLAQLLIANFVLISDPRFYITGFTKLREIAYQQVGMIIGRASSRIAVADQSIITGEAQARQLAADARRQITADAQPPIKSDAGPIVMAKDETRVIAYKGFTITAPEKINKIS